MVRVVRALLKQGGGIDRIPSLSLPWQVLYARVARSDIVISPFVLDQGLQRKFFAAQYLFTPAHIDDTTLVASLEFLLEAQIESGSPEMATLSP
jgi:hypothetical protein